MKITNPPSEIYPPGDTIREELSERGWTQSDLARITGKSTRAINQIVSGKAAITPETAQQLAGAFGSTAEYWMRREAFHRLSESPIEIDKIRERAKLYELAPLKEMEKRGWISKTASVEELESELMRFFRAEDLASAPHLPVAARTSAPPSEAFAPAQAAWCHRVLWLAQGMEVASFRQSRMISAFALLRKMSASSEGCRRVPHVLADHGIRFVIVEHLKRSKIDGVAMWLDERSPVIALSLRYDRIDYFWHSLIHEMVHIKHKDNYLLDVDMFSQNPEFSEKRRAIERRTDDEASGLLIPREKLNSFILRTKPMYSKRRIVQFANLNKIHPGIVAGQLQFRGEINYSANREMLVKVRESIIPEALTDGWGSSVNI